MIQVVESINYVKRFCFFEGIWEGFLLLITPMHLLHLLHTKSISQSGCDSTISFVPIVDFEHTVINFCLFLYFTPDTLIFLIVTCTCVLFYLIQFQVSAFISGIYSPNSSTDSTARTKSSLHRKSVYSLQNYSKRRDCKFNPDGDLSAC